MMLLSTSRRRLYASLLGTISLSLVLIPVRCLVVTVPSLDTMASRLGEESANLLNYRVAVGDKESPFQMKDMHVQLSDSLSLDRKKHSTGIYDCRLLEKPTFINDKGEQPIALESGGWEITWGPNSPHGHLVCSFVSPEQVKRNEGATLEKGRFFIRHRVWTSKTLESERERRRGIQSEAAKLLDDRDQKVKQITDTNDSLASKTWSYAQAAKTMGTYRDLGVYEARFVPLYDDQVLELIKDDCILSSRGQVFQVQSRRQGPVNIGESRVEFLKKRV
ncbi:expressed unknown protein [Seminavis robusta]|uniref:Uncharacterized protein n=1 Tax=Seminavis robusta TaxID=568900 RepID=A0A9N8EQN5_9STRA|nr:expressed unknown protein [Seminavis robusta]|eukprot:Sro1357_g265740.1 n/a (277) ;mRNA; r:7641-8471